MKRTILLASFLTHVLCLFAQQDLVEISKRLNDSLVSRFNRLDYKTMYELESITLQNSDPKEVFVSYFKSIANETGRIKAARVVMHKKNHFFYEWSGENKNQLIELIVSNTGLLEDYFFSDFIAQPYGRKTLPLTDNPHKNHLDTAVQEAASIYLSDSNSVGLAIGIYKNESPFYYDYGEIIKGSAILPKPDNKFNVGSIAKTFVAILLADAIVKGKAHLNDDIRKYLPGQYPNLEYQNQPIRLVNLANHTSGLPTSPIEMSAELQDTISKLNDSLRVEFVARHFKSFNADSLLYHMHQYKIDTLPGTKYAYNGNAMAIIILCLENIYHKPYEQILHSFLSHEGMINTSSDFSTEEINRFPQGYNNSGQAMPNLKFSQFIGAPSVTSTMYDMLIYVRANINERDSGIKLSHKPTFDNHNGNEIGLGWMIGKEHDGTKNIYHLGQTSAGFTSLCVFYPGDHSGYVVWANDMISQERLFDLVRYIRLKD